MNVVPVDPVRGHWLPDPWNASSQAVPETLEPFAAFVRANVQEHSNAAHRMTARSQARFLGYMTRHGLRPATAGSTAVQLVGEALGRRHRWSRPALLDRFQWDLFTRVWHRSSPSFATYFSNTTAHSQHLYWRYMDPASFTLKPTSDEQARFGGAIRSGYREMDRLVQAALDLVGDDATLVFCTALSQQPFVEADAHGGKRVHRPYDLAKTLDAAGIDGVTRIAPVMAEQFHVYFETPSAAARAVEALERAQVDGRPAFTLRRVDDDVFLGSAVTDDVPEGADLVVGAAPPMSFYEHFYAAETAKSGHHSSRGALWIRLPHGRPEVVEEVVPLTAVAPTLLDLMGLDLPVTLPAPSLLGVPR
jgi:hypothetical protein